MDERIKRAGREALVLSRAQIAAGTASMGGVLSRLGGSVAGLDVARNVAQAINMNLALGEDLPSATAVVAALKHRREAFPLGAWGNITDGQIEEYAALAAHAWEQAIRSARAA